VSFRKIFRKNFIRVKGYVRTVNGKPQKVRGYRRKLPANYVQAMRELARSQVEYGGEIDFRPDGSYEMTVKKGKDDRIVLEPTPGVEFIYHTHPVVDKNGKIIESEAILQRTPSPADIIIMLKMKDDENWAIPTVRDFILYKETEKTPKYSKKLEKQLMNDYHRIEAESFSKFLDIKDPKKRDIEQTEWMSQEWENLLRNKYHIYIKRFKKGQDVIITGKHIK